jgi:hypothetical protein
VVKFAENQGFQQKDYESDKLGVQAMHQRMPK